MISGQMIAGKYRINQLLGSGGMASVWSATNVFTERQFAIKFMLPSVARTPEAGRRFLMEAKVSARVDHPNIIEIIDVGQTEDGSLFLVMELLTGVPLEVAIRRQSPTMPVSEFLGVMLEVARALAAAHKNGVIHRDLKPTNIFLHKDREGAAVPKLLDFGVSKFLEEETNNALTIAGTVLGSPLYMSPEQAMGAPIDSRTDVFAYGAIMFEALTGFRAYDAPNFNALIVTIATTQPKKIDEAAPQLPEALRELVRDCLVTDREKRTKSFEIIVERLVAVIPEMEKAGTRIPKPVRAMGEPPSDPDATNALPVVRASDRPPPPSPSQPGPRSGNGPSSGFSTPYGTPPGSPSPGAATGTTTIRRQRKHTTWLMSGGAAALVVVLLAIFSLRRHGEPHAVQGDSTSDSTGATAVATPDPNALELDPQPSPSASVPVVSIDSLPMRQGRDPQPSPSERPRTGRLFITATPGWCTVSIDGTKRGPTPLSPLELSAGLHSLRCEPPGGRARTESVVVKEGATARYKFSLD